MTEAPLVRRCAAELFGTFALVFAGTGAMVVDGLAGADISHVGVAFTFGLVVMAMIYAVGDVSGAHLNPAVSLGFWLARRFPGREVAPYAISQITGAVLASLLLLASFPDAATLGQTQPAAGSLTALVFEIAMTSILMFVILGVSTGAKEKGLMAGMAIGGTVALCALFGGPVSGASMNPARSIGPAVASGELFDLWIYLIGPVTGAACAWLACRCVREPGCCSYATSQAS
ncbi:MAG: aquaporin [Gammaproteobacteria bacterium]|nr:aquaporin [Gammaproteobacteria bacterium]